MAATQVKSAIQSICQSIEKLITSARPPANVIPSIILLCSLAKRPGLSTIVSVGNIITDLAKKGFKTKKNPDGSANRLTLYTQSVVSEIYRALKNDTNIQLILEPQSIMFTGMGSNAGGPMTVTGTNMNTGTGRAALQ